MTNERLTLIALIAGPILAVVVQLLVQFLNEGRQRKVSTFRTLMGTRGMRLDARHVEALNLVPFEFRGDRHVLDRWRDYLRSLDDLTTDERVKTSEDRLVELLEQMGRSLRIPFQMHEIRREHYLPQLYLDAQLDLNRIRKMMVQVLEAEALPVRILSDEKSRGHKQGT